LADYIFSYFYGVPVGVWVDIGVSVIIGVSVGDGVFVGRAVGVGVNVGVGVGFGVGVGVFVGKGVKEKAFVGEGFLTFGENKTEISNFSGIGEIIFRGLRKENKRTPIKKITAREAKINF